MIKIGRNEIFVKIDKVVITKQKYHRKKLSANQQWFLKSVKQESYRIFVVPVDLRDDDTLLPLI